MDNQSRSSIPLVESLDKALPQYTPLGHRTKYHTQLLYHHIHRNTEVVLPERIFKVQPDEFFHEQIEVLVWLLIQNLSWWCSWSENDHRWSDYDQTMLKEQFLTHALGPLTPR